MIRKSTRPPLRINAPNEDVLGRTDHAGIGKWSVARRLTLVTHVDGASLFLGKAFLRQHPGSAGRAQRPAFLRHGAFRGELRDAQSGGSLTPLLPGPADRCRWARGTAVGSRRACGFAEHRHTKAAVSTALIGLETLAIKHNPIIKFFSSRQ